jgi:hypothetical protein
LFLDVIIRMSELGLTREQRRAIDGQFRAHPPPLHGVHQARFADTTKGRSRGGAADAAVR